MEKNTPISQLTAAARRSAGSGSCALPQVSPGQRGSVGDGGGWKGANTLRGSELSETCPLSSSLGCSIAEVWPGWVCRLFFLDEVLGYTSGFQNL